MPTAAQDLANSSVVPHVPPKSASWWISATTPCAPVATVAAPSRRATIGFVFRAIRLECETGQS